MNILYICLEFLPIVQKTDLRKVEIQQNIEFFAFLKAFFILVIDLHYSFDWAKLVLTEMLQLAYLA